MEKKVYERVQLLLEKQKITAHELAKILGINPQSVYNYLDGKSKAPMSFILLILESFPDISAEWLLRGEDPMIKPKKHNYYLDMAARVNGTMMASESNDHEPLKPQFTLDTIFDSLKIIDQRLSNLENNSKH